MKMELVLSPGNLEGDADAPFRNEDVREWSRVDRITGMLERARVETGRWRANTQDAAQSYGKMVDSRERNSADGSLIQKARRQVEIFQSQGTSGRNFQIVRASQWSSSRATDCGFDAPTTKPSNTHYANEAMNGSTSPPSPRLSLWRTSLDSEASSDLERLSLLCRKLHNEAMSTTSNLWSLRAAARSPSPLAFLENSTRFQELDQQLSIGERRSNSSEDLGSLLSADEASFARDCKTRRSLQIPSIVDQVEDGRMRRTRNDFIAERARRFENNGRGNENSEVKRNYISTKSFTSIADNDFVKNDPKHPSKLGQQVAKISIQDNAQNGKTVQVGSPVLPRSSRRANNKTVVHLRNAEDGAEPTRCINVTAIKLENKPDAEYGLLMDASSSPAAAVDSPPEPKSATNGNKPVKKVEFCKTEIHFAADSGKVNIVETDGKPPPTNKFRRRRRNNSLGAASNGNAQKSNMPLVHFGDTSYEKYIFGGGELPQEYKKTALIPSDDEARGRSYDVDSETKKDRWDSPEKTREDVGGGASKEICPAKDSTDPDKTADHNNKFRGTHTTTVNILGDESGVLPRAASEGGRRKIQLQFAASNRCLSPLNLADEDTVVSRTTKITVHLQPPCQRHRPRIHQNNHPFANLKSVKLVMSIGQMMADRGDSLALERLFSSLCNKVEPQLSWSLQLKAAEESADDGEERSLESADAITDKPSSIFPTTNHISHKEIGPLIEKSLPNENQVISKDSDNNQVLLKIVTTHKPLLARVESDHPIAKPRTKTQPTAVLEDEKVVTEKKLVEDTADKEVTDPEAKDHCDNISSDAVSNRVEEAPTYENVFDVVNSDDAPLYENFRSSTDDAQPKKRSTNAQTENLLANSHDRRHKKVNGEAKQDRVVKSRSVTPMSSMKSDKNSLEKSKVNSRTSSSRDNSVKRYKDAKLVKEDSVRGRQARRKSSSKVNPAAQEHKSTPSASAEKNGGTIKSKKPVEVVYQTAIYNMKNEKLSKPKPKEVKGPRLLNDLICGSKLRRPSDNKRTIKPAVTSQNTSKRKETPTTLNR